ncbi:MAG: hypothetical protein A2X81_18360 [Desulfobacterales bacterium GWB2_56_26]|nr:MAG: hypothetical protein A2X81_18360 [Desulfobacterales bacterium GWB2_56_26]
MGKEQNAGYAACCTAIDKSWGTPPAILFAISHSFAAKDILTLQGASGARGPPAHASDANRNLNFNP